MNVSYKQLFIILETHLFQEMTLHKKKDRPIYAGPYFEIVYLTRVLQRLQLFSLF